MKKLIVIMLALIFVDGAYAQHETGVTTIYPRIGMSLYKLSSSSILTGADGVELNAKNKVGLVVGAEVKHQFRRGFAASVGLLYTMQGSRFDDYEAVSETDATYEVMKTKITTHVLNVPLLAVFDISSRLSLKCGVQLGFMMSAKNTIDSETGTVVSGDRVKDESLSGKTSMTVNDAFNRFDVAIPIGLSYEYKNVAIDLRYNIGLTNVYKYAELKEKNRGLMLTVGYAFPLKHKAKTQDKGE